MRQGFLVLTLLLSFFSCQVLADTAQSAPALDVPAVLLCKSVDDCDRDPAHLEKFVVDFFEWYLDNAARIRKIRPNINRKIPEQGRQLVIKKILSPNFYNNLDKIIEKTDSDPITCAQDFYPQWITDSSARLEKIDSDSAYINLSLPLPKGNTYRLFVELKIIKGEWRINSIHHPPN